MKSIIKNRKHKKINILKFLFTVFWFTLYTLHFTLYTVLAAPHISGKHIPGQPKDHVHKIPDVRQLRALGLSPKAISEAIGATGSKKVAVILVNFASAGTNTSDAETMSSSDITGFNTTFSALKNFYNEVSYNQLDLQITFFYSGGSASSLSGNETPFTLNKTMSYYGQDTDNSSADLIKDTLNAAGGNVTKTNYDYVMVAHAGYGNESTNNSGDIWSSFITWTGAVSGFSEGTIVPARESGGRSCLGVTCHEFGHQLGLPDLYATAGAYAGETQVGKWCLMDLGTWANNGANPSHPSLWCKRLLGWVNPVSISSTVINTSLPAIEVSSQGIRVPIPTATNPNNEYFLLEYRYKDAASYDKSLPGSGILIWHIDDSVGNIADNNINNNPSHRRVDLEEADNSDPSSNDGDANDPWPGTELIFSAPQANAYNGSSSGVTILNFAGAGSSTMTFDISFAGGLYGYVRRIVGIDTPLAGATLKASGNNVSIETTSGSNGYYTLIISTPGNYTLQASLSGYRTTTYYGVPVSTVGMTQYDIRLEVEPLTVTGKDNLVVGKNLFNPKTGEVAKLRMNLSQPSKVSVRVYDIAGDLVKEYPEEDGHADNFDLSWDGKNDDQQIVVPGVYFIYIKTDTFEKIEKVGILRQ